MHDDARQESCPDAFIAFAHRLADAAGEAIRPHFRAGAGFDLKSDDSPVTAADREGERVMRELIETTYPAHGIVGEEFGTVRAGAELVWVLDPIDGTRSFISGKPVFGILIALMRDGAPILGIIDQPVSRERWLGAAGRTSTLNGQPIATRGCPRPERAVLYTSGPEWFEGAQEAAFLRLRNAVRMCLYNADCYAFGLLAAGFVDIAVECRLQPYDYCALVPVVEGAGGVITDWRGAALGLEGDGTVLAAGDAVLHRAALALLAG